MSNGGRVGGVRPLTQIPSPADEYHHSLNSAQADFAYSAGGPQQPGGGGGGAGSYGSGAEGGGHVESWANRGGGGGVRPSTSTSSLSAGSTHSAIATPPGLEEGVAAVHGADSDMARCE